MLNKIATATPKALPSFISQQMPEGIGVIGLVVFSQIYASTSIQSPFTVLKGNLSPSINTLNCISLKTG